MKTTLKFFSAVALVSSACLFGCKKDEVLPDETDTALVLENSIKMQVEKSNSDNNYTSNVASMSPLRKSSAWLYRGDNELYLYKSATFELTLENGEQVEFELWFGKHEPNPELVNLEDEDLDYWKRGWDYKNFNDEINNFYKDFGEVRVIINNNVIYHTELNEAFQFVEAHPKTENNVDKSHLTYTFNGTAFGWYDPSGQNQEVYGLFNGTFKGVIE